jgi:hypothetical protein
MYVEENRLPERKRNEGTGSVGGNVAKQGKSRRKENGGNGKGRQLLQCRNGRTNFLFLCNQLIGERQGQKEGRHVVARAMGREPEEGHERALQ